MKNEVGSFKTQLEQSVDSLCVFCGSVCEQDIDEDGLVKWPCGLVVRIGYFRFNPLIGIRVEKICERA